MLGWTNLDRQLVPLMSIPVRGREGLAAQVRQTRDSVLRESHGLEDTGNEGDGNEGDGNEGDGDGDIYGHLYYSPLLKATIHELII